MMIVAVLLGAISLVLYSIQNSIHFKMKLSKAIVVAFVQLIVVIAVSMFVSLVFINHK